MKELKLNKDIYSNHRIVNAISAYSGFAEMEMHNRGKHWLIVFLNCKYDEELTIKEFENYLIGLENN